MATVERPTFKLAVRYTKPKTERIQQTTTHVK